VSDEPRRPTPIRIGLLGPYGTGNLGDAAIQDAVIQNLRARLPVVRFVAICQNPRDAVARHGVEAIPLRAEAPQGGKAGLLNYTTGRLHAWQQYVRHSLRDLRLLDLLMMSGGGQIDDYWGGPTGHPLTLGLWTAGARCLGVPTAFCSVGADQIASPVSKLLFGQVLARAAYVSAREEDSARLIRAISDRRDVGVVPDLAFSLPVSQAQRDFPPTDSTGLTLAVAPIAREAIPGSAPTQYRRYLENLVQAVVQLARVGHHIIVFESQTRMDAFPASEVTRSVRAQVPQAAVEHASPTTVRELASLLSRTHVVLASRLHALLLAAVVHRPIVALSYAPKVDRLLLDLDMPQNCLGIFRASAPEIMMTVGHVITHQAKYRRAIASKTLEWGTILSEQYDLIIRLAQQRRGSPPD
jgi:polysaccharide pyruvyl transferase WcaK-like protein